MMKYTFILATAVAVVASCIVKPPAPKPPTSPVAPSTMTVHVQVNAAAGVPGATVKVQSAVPDTWATCSTDTSGHCYVLVPSTLTESHLKVAPPAGYLPVDRHVSVAKDITLIVDLQPEHKPWPDSAQWSRFRCDLDGVPVPSIKPYGLTDSLFTIIYPVYPGSVRQDALAAYKARGYTHYPIDAYPWYAPYYPSGKFPTAATFKPVVRELLDADLMPVFMMDPGDTSTSDSPEKVVAAFAARYSDIFADPELVSLLKIVTPAWEANDHISPAAYEAILVWLHARLNPDALVFVHMTPYHAAMSGEAETEQQWWSRMASKNLVNGIEYQHQVTDTIQGFKDRIADFTDRLVGGKNGWPTKRADGRPLYVEVFEYDAYWRTRGQTDEATGIAWGKAALEVPGVSGYCDGGPIK